MRRTVLFCGLVLFVIPAPALAQVGDPLQPRVDLGFAFAGGPVPHTNSERFLQPRVGVALTRRFAIEGIVDVRRNRETLWTQDVLRLYYTVQGRRLIGPQTGRVSTAITFGGTGLYDRRRSYIVSNGVRIGPWRTRSEFYLPIAPTAGVAVQYVVTPRLAIRGDVQTIICPYFDSIGVVPAVGVSVPIGHAYRR
jgi:hypothetical protein